MPSCVNRIAVYGMSGGAVDFHRMYAAQDGEHSKALMSRVDKLDL
jgi:hypothetical protein